MIKFIHLSTIEAIMKVFLVMLSIGLLLYSIMLTTLVFNGILEVKRTLEYIEFKADSIAEQK